MKLKACAALVLALLPLAAGAFERGELRERIRERIAERRAEAAAERSSSPPSAPGHVSAPTASGGLEKSVVVDGVARDYIEFLPQGRRLGRGLVLVFHGGGGSAKRFASQTRFAQEALARGDAALYLDRAREPRPSGRG